MASKKKPAGPGPAGKPRAKKVQQNKPIRSRGSKQRAGTPFDTASQYDAGGLSCIPVLADGSKKPRGRWKAYQSRRPTFPELRECFDRPEPTGIAIVCGNVSRNLEVIDVDDSDTATEFREVVERSAPGLLNRLPQVATPSGGLHVYLRSKGKIEGNQKLAQRADDDPLASNKRTLIETRGEGGYVIAPGSHPNCHPSGREYRHVGGPPIEQAPTIAAGERDALMAVARSLNRRVRIVNESKPARIGNGVRPGDDFNQRASWPEILNPCGWRSAGRIGNVELWRRPGKPAGSSATTGFCQNGNADLLYVFSSNAAPFEAGCAYTKFAAYALLNHDGNFGGAARALAQEGYGQQRAEARDEAVVVSMADVEAEEVRFLWPDRIPLGKLTLVVGDPGLGKSFLTIYAASRLTRGDCFPGCDTPVAVGSVVILSAEDDPADTIKPRLIAAGADIERVHVLQGIRATDSRDTPQPFQLERHLQALEREIERIGDVRLVVIDPVSAYCGRTDTHKNADVRALLAPLAGFAARHHVAVIAVTHLTKGQGNAIHRAMGSMAFIAAARAGHLVVKDPADRERRLFLPIKSNLGPSPPGLAFRVVKAQCDPAAVVQWEPGTVSITAEEALRPPNANQGEALLDLKPA